ncbi:MAG TPA: integrin alpha, partial [Polyangiaceae bacterium]|nr:integrin alpha [Polyangiaceae bacterium]
MPELTERSGQAGAETGAAGSTTEVLQGPDAGLDEAPAGPGSGDAGAQLAEPAPGTGDAGSPPEPPGASSSTLLALESLATTPTRGFVIAGTQAGDNAGLSVDMAGDVNGDGLGDIIVGAPHTFESGPGYAYVVFGRADDANVTLSAPDTPGFLIEGTGGGHLGVAVAGAGDVNGDGFDDLVLGEPSVNSELGAAYVVFGKADARRVALSTLAADAAGFVIYCAAPRVAAGRSVDGAGDFNGDGLDDVAIGAFGTNNASGRVHVVFGKLDTDVVDLGTLGAAGYIIEGGNVGLGVSVSAAGDINQDGLDDVIIGDSIGLEEGGAAHVVFGSRVGATLDVGSLAADPTRGYQLVRADPLGNVGFAVSGVRDLNGDDIDDVATGAPFAKPLVEDARSGIAYAVYGQREDAQISLLEVERYTGAGGFAIPGAREGDLTGTAVSAAGDFNHDGFDDLLVGADGAGLGEAAVACPERGACTTGMAYVFWGQPFGNGRPPVTESLAEVERGAPIGMAFAGVDIADHTGVAVAGGADVNGDGLDDILIGAPGAFAYGGGQATEAGAAGRVYVAFGAHLPEEQAEWLGVRRSSVAGTSADDTLPYDYVYGRIDGGNGFDTLQPIVASVWDVGRGSLTVVDGRDDYARFSDARVSSIECIDLSLAAGSSLYLSDEVIRRLPQSRPGLPFGLAKTLVVLGGA